ncbi:MAG: hypothetical protein AB7K24_19025 [Gemmataceae bacterium]
MLPDQEPSRSRSVAILGLGAVVIAAGLGLYFALPRTPQAASEEVKPEARPEPEQLESELAILDRLEAQAPVSAKERLALAERWLARADKTQGADQLHACRRAFHWYRLAAWQQGDADERVLNGMARAAAVIEPADAAAARFTLYQGNWHTTYGDIRRDYFVRDDGLVLIRDASDGRAGWQGQAVRKDGVVLFNWEKGAALDRPTLSGNRWQLERFFATDYPDRPLATGSAIFTGPEPPSSFAPAQLIVCARREGNARLLRASLDGDLEPYANELGNSLCPAWSPDGSRIVFVSTRDRGRRHLFVMDADGKNLKQLTSGASECRCPAWSPDGTKIAFALHRGPNAQVYVMDVNRNNLKNLSNDGAFSADPAWSPDGTRIAVASNRSVGGFRLYVMNADGSNQRELNHEGIVIGSVYPAWSPDGQSIVYSGPYQGGLALYAVDPEGKQQRRLADLPGRNTFATWSPDGKAIAFANFSGSASAIYVVSPRGTVSPTQVRCDLVEDDGRIAWRPLDVRR